MILIIAINRSYDSWLMFPRISIYQPWKKDAKLVSRYFCRLVRFYFLDVAVDLSSCLIQHLDTLITFKYIQRNCCENNEKVKSHENSDSNCCSVSYLLRLSPFEKAWRFEDEWGVNSPSRPVSFSLVYVSHTIRYHLDTSFSLVYVSYGIILARYHIGLVSDDSHRK